MNWLFEKWIRLSFPNKLVPGIKLHSNDRWIFDCNFFIKYFNGWNFYLDILQVQENWAGRNFITNSRVFGLFIAQAKMQTEINNN